MSLMDTVAKSLDHWFSEDTSRYQEVTNGLAGDDPYRRQLITHGAVARSAQKLLGEAGDDDPSSLFSSACVLLGAGAQFLGISVDAENWKAAVENVFVIQQQLDSARDVAFGLPSTAAQLFLAETRTQLENAGFGHAPSLLDEANRRRALGMAMNFALRFLVAIGIEGGANDEPAYTRFRDTLRRLRSTEPNVT